ncbi:1-phosphatidylinositol-3-phosphate 5-kinase, partial [Irineochytrium annulatum]
ADTRRNSERSKRRNVKMGHPRPSKYSARAINRQLSTSALTNSEDGTGRNSVDGVGGASGGSVLDGALGGGLAGTIHQDGGFRSGRAGGFRFDVGSLTHMGRMLDQLLAESGVVGSSPWREVILSMAIKVALNVVLDVKSGDDMDVGHYIKIKKIPGGRPEDSEYVSGFVCSKGVPHKRMLRTIHQPRILLLTFAIEYGETQFTSIEHFMALEREYLQALVARIMSLRPTLVLVERTVCRVALEMFLAENVTIVHSVKPSVIEAIARCTRAQIITSPDQLTSESIRGTCDAFAVKTYDNALIPGRRKTFLSFSGCPKELGCTIVIRGGDMALLERIKQVTNLIVFVAYNLRLEASLFRDELASLPPPAPDNPVDNTLALIGSANAGAGAGADAWTMPILKAILLYERTLLSASPRVRFPPPYLLLRIRDQMGTSAGGGGGGEANGMRDDEASAPLREKKPVSSISAEERSLASSDGRLTGLSGPPAALSPSAEITLPMDSRTHVNKLIQGAELLSPFNSQNIMFLFSSICTETMMPCQPPENHVIEYYRETDMTLGQYLEGLCYNANFICQSCNLPMLRHFRSYAHGQGRVNVVIEELESSEERIMMWSYCKVCKQRTPSIPMSEDTWKYSFGKYLELTYYHADLSCSVATCNHDIHRQHVRFFGLRNLTVRFEYDTIDLLEISVPSIRVRANEELQMKWKNEEYQGIRQVISAFYDSIVDRVKVFAYEVLPQSKITQLREHMNEFARRATAEKKMMLQSLQHTFIATPPSDCISMNCVLKLVHEKAPSWDTEFTSMIRSYLQTEQPDLRKFTAMQIKKIFSDSKEVTPTNVASSPSGSATLNVPQMPTSVSIPNGVVITSATPSPPNPTVNTSSATSANIPPYASLAATPPNLQASTSIPNLQSNPTPLTLPPSSTVLTARTPTPTTASNSTAGNATNGPSSSSNTSSSRPAIPSPSGNASSSRLSEFYDMARFQPPHATTLLKGSVSDALEASLRLRLEGLHVPTGIIEEEGLGLVGLENDRHRGGPGVGFDDDEDEEEAVTVAGGRRRLRLDGHLPLANARSLLAFGMQSPTMTREASDDGPGGLGVTPSMASLTAAAMAAHGPGAVAAVVGKGHVDSFEDEEDAGSAWNLITGVTRSEAERYGGAGVFGDGDGKEVAAERSDLYKTRLASSQTTYNSNDQDSIDALEVEESGNGDIEETLLRPGNHFQFQFMHGPAKLDCKTYYAEQFDALRRNCGFQEMYIQSLSRCFRWEALGGKSGSTFMKTKDDRLILKQLSRQEMDALLKFARYYFNYVSEGFFHKLPTVLAKIFGFYRIACKNAVTGKNFKMDVVVMENLFYDRKISRIFDLKGSKRNRHIQSTGRQNEVLLDENLVEFIGESPLFIREHSKILLRNSVFNDTLFLAKLNVMDYSLLVGIDEEKRELVVGIVDYIRTYTWDKKVESWVKENAFMGARDQPTILSPRQYKLRFRESMERYFLSPPTKPPQPGPEEVVYR